MAKDKKLFTWDYFKDIYENTLQKNISFSDEMNEQIKKELEKMYKQREEWLKNNKKNG